MTKAMLQRTLEKGTYGDAVSSRHGREGHKSRGRTNAMSSPSVSPSSYNQDICKKFESCALFDKRLHNPRVNSAADDSSLLGYSDDSYRSTESTREFFSTSEDSDNFSYSLPSSRHSNLCPGRDDCSVERVSSALYSDRTDQRRKLSEQCSSSSSLLRRPKNKERSTQTFY